MRRIFPLKVRYVNDLPERYPGSEVRAWCRDGRIVEIVKKYQDDHGLFVHERTHYRQWLRWFAIHRILYAKAKWYKFRCEAEAYANQLLSYPKEEFYYKRNLFGGFISDWYGLEVTKEEAMAMIDIYISKIKE